MSELAKQAHDLAAAFGRVAAHQRDRAANVFTCPGCGHVFVAAKGKMAAEAHCPDCHRVWTGVEQEAHCAACCRHFSSDSAFDAHLRTPPPDAARPFETCRDPAMLRKADGSPRLVCVETGHGPTWTHPEMPAEAIAALKGNRA